MDSRRAYTNLLSGLKIISSNKINKKITRLWASTCLLKRPLLLSYLFFFETPMKRFYRKTLHLLIVLAELYTIVYVCVCYA